MESMNLLVQKYVWQVDLFIKLQLFSPQYKENRTLKEILDALFISQGLPQNQCGATILLAKRNNKKLSFQKKIKKFYFFRIQSIPYKKWKGRNQIEIFKMQGCLSKVQLPISKRIKIRPMTVDCKIRLEQSREGSKRPRKGKKDNVLNKEIQRCSKYQRTFTSFEYDVDSSFQKVVSIGRLMHS